MAEEKRHFDENSDPRISDKFSADLKALFKPQLKVPPEVDRAIMDRASQHFVRRRPRLVLRWTGSVAAVAAVIMLVAILNFTHRPALQKARQPHEAAEFASKVQDRYVVETAKAPKAELKSESVMAMAGKLKADKLKDFDSIARRSLISIERADFDKSGRVDILDAFKLAKSIQSKKQLDTKWDVNGDGIINRADVDSVAYTAVHLDARGGSS